MAVISRKKQRGADRRPENRRALELDELRAAALETVIKRHDERPGRTVLVFLERPLAVGRVAGHEEVGEH